MADPATVTVNEDVPEELSGGEGTQESVPGANSGKEAASGATDAVKDSAEDGATGDDGGLIGPLKKAAVTAAVAARLVKSRRFMTSPISGAGERPRP